MERIKSIVSENLRSLRGDLSRKEVSDSIGVNVSTYGRWETGVAWIDPASIEKIASFYGVSSSRLFFDPDLENPSPDSLVSRPSAKEIKKALQAVIDLLDK